MRLIKWAVLTPLLLASGVLVLGQTRSERFELGEQYSFFSNQHGYLGGQHLLGGRFDIRVSRHVWLTSQLEAGLGNGLPPEVSSADGGRIVVGCFGFKAGSEWQRFGFFGEIRGGFSSWSGAIQNIVWGSSIRFGRLTQPLLNSGATFEFYARPNTGFRISLGDSIAFYASRTVAVGDPAHHAFRSNSVHVSTGLFYRF